jgi:hypothetical protein
LRVCGRDREREEQNGYGEAMHGALRSSRHKCAKGPTQYCRVDSPSTWSFTQIAVSYTATSEPLNRTPLGCVRRSWPRTSSGRSGWDRAQGRPERNTKWERGRERQDMPAAMAKGRPART